MYWNRTTTTLFMIVLLFHECCFTEAAFNLGALLRQQPQGLTTTSIGDRGGDHMKVLKEASEFFVDAWWTDMVGGMFKPRQRESLERAQFMGFRGQYSPSKVSAAENQQAELLFCQVNDEIIGCAGLEIVDVPLNMKGIQQQGTSSPASTTRAPLMGDVAVSRQFRRKGIAELLVSEIEQVAVEWGYDKCYLYVAKENTPAVKLYQKLGYRQVWEDDDGKTKVPTDNGNLQSKPTTIVCMKRALDRGILGRLSLPFF